MLVEENMDDDFNRRFLEPDREVMKCDPFGYAAAANEKLKAWCARDGLTFELELTSTAQNPTDPVLWFSQARALSYAASEVITHEPTFGVVTPALKSICDSQYCAVGLMLLGYSLEVCMKGMLVIEYGVDHFRANERLFHHHRLHELADVVPGLSEREYGILRILSYFTTWAGRYPEPGSKKEAEYVQIYAESEKLRVTLADLLDVSKRVMNHAESYVDRVNVTVSAG